MLALLAIGCTLILAGIVSALAISRNRSLQVDEVEHVHAAYSIADGRALYRDYWQSHNPLLYVVLQPLVRVDDPIGTFRRARAFVAVLMFCTIALSAWTAHRLAGSVGGAVAAAQLLFETTFAERGIEIRPDNLVALAVAAALALQVSRIREGRRFCLQGLLLGVAFLATSKAIVLTTAFGALWAASAIRRRRPILLLGPTASWLFPLGIAAAILAGLGLLDDWARWNLAPYFRHVSRSLLPDATFTPWEYLLRDAGRNVFFYASFFMAVVCVAVLAILRRPQAGPLSFPVVLAFAGLVFLRLNPFPFPYNFVAVLPTCAVLGGAIWGLLAAQLSRSGSRALTVASLVGLCIALAALPPADRRFRKSLVGNDHQLATLRTVSRLTAPNDPVFDLVGMYFRPDAYPVYTMTGVMMKKYRLGIFPPIIPALLQNEVTVCIDNYRMMWLPEAEKRFLSDHFIRYGRAVLIPGTVIRDLKPGAARRFRVLREKPFRYTGDGSLLVDGAPFEVGVLMRGVHVLTAAIPISSGVLHLDVPPPERDDVPRAVPLFEHFD